MVKKSPSGRKIVDARNGPDDTISHVLIEGNVRMTPVATAIRMAEQGKIDGAHIVRRRGAKVHLRTNPDDAKANNLDDLASD